MATWCKTEIREINIRIPKKDFPLKSDSIVGFDSPLLLYPNDEVSVETEYLQESGDFFVLSRGPDVRGLGNSLFLYEANNACIEELEELAVQYNGTLVAFMKCEGESNNEKIIIRDGKRKKLRIIEEDE